MLVGGQLRLAAKFDPILWPLPTSSIRDRMISRSGSVIMIARKIFRRADRTAQRAPLRYIARVPSGSGAVLRTRIQRTEIVSVDRVTGGGNPPPVPTGRVEDWRAGLGRGLCSLVPRPFGCECRNISTMPRFQSPPRRSQHADFPHYAHLFASRLGLWDLSCRGDFGCCRRTR